ncbi:hypothetical protein B0O80DRAFT_46755 [Mortierella sp. GBAus27b]|nr:chitin deacetylase [Mortierella sp. GBA43]KAI8354780.1 hypothetical protein B0O80DRAFT_46755 [Mortierella sp. GBAus27b]
MAPITRLAAIALVFTALASASPSPVLAPSAPDAPAPAFVRDGNYAVAAAPKTPKVKAPKVKVKGTSVPVGKVIERCTTKGVVAITFDDGPGHDTDKLLEYIRSRKEKPKVTFFINGNNGDLLEKDKVKLAALKKAYADGHQIASHTWSHPHLTKLSEDGVKKEMTNLEAVIKRQIGKVPAYMRPPYGETNSKVLKVLAALKYHVINWSLDTNDWQHPNDVKKGLKVYEDNLNAKSLKEFGHIVLEHDTEGLTPTQLGPQAIDLAIKRGFKVVTVAECLGDKGNEYK